MKLQLQLQVTPMLDWLIDWFPPLAGTYEAVYPFDQPPSSVKLSKRGLSPKLEEGLRGIHKIWL